MITAVMRQYSQASMSQSQSCIWRSCRANKYCLKLKEMWSLKGNFRENIGNTWNCKAYIFRLRGVCFYFCCGGSTGKATVLKTVIPKGYQGSTPCPSAHLLLSGRIIWHRSQTAKASGCNPEGEGSIPSDASYADI